MKLRGTKRHLIFALVMVLILSGITWAAFSQQRSEPENRTGQKTDSSLMLTAEGNSLKVSEKVKDNIKKENKTKKDDKKEDKKNKDNKKEGKTDSRKSDGKGRKNKGKTDVVYFTTTIKDGETVTKKDYSFSIKHKISSLTPKKTLIYVNGKLTDSISDARTDFTMLLSEGENSVRVQVVYETRSGQEISPYKNYTINVDTRHLVITTSLKDGMKVESAYLGFTASAAFGEDDVDVIVEYGGRELSRVDGSYEAELEKGENIFTISAEYDSDHKLRDEYRIYYQPPKGLHIETDLKDQTVKAVDPDFTFRAEAVGGGAKTEFTVSMNNKIIKGENGVYDVKLVPQGEKAYNTIRLKASDGKEEDSATFKIKYIPLATPETEPSITHINISDGQTVKKKNPYTLELAAKDYKGKKIYYDGMDVYLNGRHQIVRDTNPYVTYKLNFSEGKNIVRIIITDDDGRVKEFSYTVNYVRPDDNEKIGTVTVSMDANVLGLGSMISGATTDLLAGDNAAKVIVRVLESKGFGCISSGSTDQGFYLSAISRSGIGRTEHIPEALKDEIDDHGITWQGSRDEPERSMNSLGEKDYTQGSGWIILVDGRFISESASAVDLHDGSIVKVRYTLAYGMDIGGTYQGSTFSKTY